MLCDVAAVREVVQYQEDAGDFEPTSPSISASRYQQENICEIGRRAAQLRKVHPRLVSTAMVLINRAAGRTIWVRTPDEFLGEFASWFWDGDPNATDEEARESLDGPVRRRRSGVRALPSVRRAGRVVSG